MARRRVPRRTDKSLRVSRSAEEIQDSWGPWKVVYAKVHGSASSLRHSLRTSYGVHALASLIGVGPNQLRVGIEEVVGG